MQDPLQRFHERSLAEWTDVLRQASDVEERYRALQAVILLADRATVVDLLAEALLDADSGVRAGAGAVWQRSPARLIDREQKRLGPRSNGAGWSCCKTPTPMCDLNPLAGCCGRSSVLTPRRTRCWTLCMNPKRSRRCWPEFCPCWSVLGRRAPRSAYRGSFCCVTTIPKSVSKRPAPPASSAQPRQY